MEFPTFLFDFHFDLRIYLKIVPLYVRILLPKQVVFVLENEEIDPGRWRYQNNKYQSNINFWKVQPLGFHTRQF